MIKDNADSFRDILQDLYGHDANVYLYQSERYKKLLAGFQAKYDTESAIFFSTPGRTELGGNHTDHNHGLVLAAAVNLDTVAAAHPVPEPVVTISSQGYPAPFIISLNELKPVSKEKGTTAALIRGIAYKMKDMDFQIGGFNALITSDVHVGSGLSSSASIEVMIGNIFNYFYNNGTISQEIIARIAQYAENNYFGKPCGLMDQIVCATGGIVKIDFKDESDPIITPVEYDFDKSGYKLVIVNTGGDHTDLTDDYASIPIEMKSLASYYGKKVCRDLDSEKIFRDISALRSVVGDRAILRAFHFFRENERVRDMVHALESGNFENFLQLSNQSGDSSFKWLQNIFTNKKISRQGVSLALALTEEFIRSEKITAACRVHGGGFAGTIQALIPFENVHNYTASMNSVFGKKAAQVVTIRKAGSRFLGNLTRKS